MNFYQKMYGLITLLVIGVSAMIIFVFFDSPYTKIFQMETAAILAAELLVGLCIIDNVRKNDTMLVHVAGYSVIALVYLLFTLGMIAVACSDILPVRFLAIHITGFAAAVILMMVFFIAEHHFGDREPLEVINEAQKQDFRNRMQEIAAEAGAAFAGNRNLLLAVNRLAEDTRFLADPSSATAVRDQEIADVMDAMKEAVRQKNQTAFSDKLERLGILFRIREKRM